MLFRARGLLILAATFIVIIPPVSAQESMPGMMMPMMGRDTTTAPALPRGEMFDLTQHSRTPR